MTGKRVEDGNCRWFDAKVTEIGPVIFKTLAGYTNFQYIIVKFTLTSDTGESHSASNLFYRAIDLPMAEELDMKIWEGLKDEAIDESAGKVKDSVVENVMDEAHNKVGGKPRKEVMEDTADEAVEK